MTPKKRRAAAVAVPAALALALSGALIPTSAFAEEETLAPTSGAAFDATAKQLLAYDSVAAVGRDADDNVVVYTSESLEGESKTFTEVNANIVVRDIGTNFTAYADTDVVGGAGIATADPDSTTGEIGLCSIGFSAWNPQGEPAILTAGHCTDDGGSTASLLTLPSGDTAGGGAAEDLAPAYELGELAFSQYGSTNNGAGFDGDENATDVAAYDITNHELTTFPEVTDWSTASRDDLSLSTKTITSVGTVEPGTVTKSGRTTGYTTGTVGANDIIGGWARISNPNDVSDVRFVYGFSAQLESDSGDSGGSIIQGGTAVGILSGGNGTLTWGADLTRALEITPGYSVQLDLAEPTVTSKALQELGGSISGTGPAGAKLNVAFAGEGSTRVNIDADGTWTAALPEKAGRFEVSLRAVDGFNESELVQTAVRVIPAPPVITTPAADSAVETKVTKVSGTGFPGATVNLGGDAKGSATVGGDGKWTVAVELGYDAYSLTATQSSNGVTSEASAPVAFAIVPTAPGIDSIADGQVFTEGQVETVVAGDGVAGAAISVFLDGQAVVKTEVDGDRYAALLPGQPGVGEHTVRVVQTINGQASESTIGFVVEAAPEPAPAAPPVDPTEPTIPVVPNEPTPADPAPADPTIPVVPTDPADPELAETGSDLAVAPIAGGLLALLAGLALVVTARVRRAHAE
jgi:hypothetical protein